MALAFKQTRCSEPRVKDAVSFQDRADTGQGKAFFPTKPITPRFYHFSVWLGARLIKHRKSGKVSQWELLNTTASSWSPLHFTEAFSIIQPKETSFPLRTQVDPSASPSTQSHSSPLLEWKPTPPVAYGTPLTQKVMFQHSKPCGPQVQNDLHSLTWVTCFLTHSPKREWSSSHFSLLTPSQSSGFDLEVTCSRKPLPSKVWDQSPSLCFHSPITVFITQGVKVPYRWTSLSLPTAGEPTESPVQYLTFA